MTVTLQGLSTALAPHLLPQDVVGRRAEEILGTRHPRNQSLLRTFGSAGIERRRSVAPFDWFDEGAPGWAERGRLRHDGYAATFRDAARAAPDGA